MLKKLQEKIFKKPIIKIAFIFAVLLLIGGGLYIIQKKKQQQAKNTSPQTEAPKQERESESTNQPTTEDETAVWKVYQSKKYSFSFKYPKDWRLADKYMSSFIEEAGGPRKNELEDYIVLTTVSSQEEQDFITKAKNTKAIALSAWYPFALGKSVIIEPKIITKSQYLQSSNIGIVTQNTNVKEIVTQSGVKGIRLDRREKNDNGDFFYDAVLFENNNSIFPTIEIRIEKNKAVEYETSRPIFEQIFNSFRYGK